LGANIINFQGYIFHNVGVVFYLFKKKLFPWEESKETFMLVKAFPKKDDFNCILATLKAILLMGLLS
jgi:hypothetical protein